METDRWKPADIIERKGKEREMRQRKKKKWRVHDRSDSEAHATDFAP